MSVLARGGELLESIRQAAKANPRESYVQRWARDWGSLTHKEETTLLSDFVFHGLPYWLGP
jgi:hypothetical protein